MDPESKWLDEVVGFYRGGVYPAAVAGSDSAEIQTRLEVLRYGYEARTRRTLEEHFPRFRQTLTEVQWMELGGEYSRGTGREIAYLGELPQGFFQYCLNLSLSYEAERALRLDYAVYLSAKRAFYEDRCVRSLENLSQISCLKRQPSVVLEKWADERWVISRNRSDFFVRSVDSERWQGLEILVKARMPEDLVDLFSSEMRLAEFFLMGVHCCWFEVSGEPSKGVE